MVDGVISVRKTLDWVNVLFYKKKTLIFGCFLLKLISLGELGFVTANIIDTNG